MKLVQKRVIRMLVKSAVNSAGTHHCATLISAGDVDKTSSWGFDAADGDALLGPQKDDWANYAKWFLGEDTTAAANTEARYKYPYGKGGKVYRSALVAIRSRAAQQNDDPVFKAAGEYLDQVDGTKNYTGSKSLGMVQRAWSKFESKGMTETDTHYVFKGIATTPAPDRSEDIVESMGAMYDLPMPFLWQHDATQPVGEVFEAAPTKSGIPVSVRIPKLTTPGKLKDRLDEAVQSIQLKLVKGLSIGFAPIEYSYMEDTGGYRFMKWMWLELSGVTIPANAQATIKSIKASDAKSRPSSGKKRLSINTKAAVAVNDERGVPQLNLTIRSKRK